jgi:enoyl-CoA hydratase/carnithine racemase
MSEMVLARSDPSGVVELRLNRAGRRNALSTQVLSELREHLASVAEDPSIRVVVVTGEGPAFCAGADTGEFAADAEGVRVRTRSRLLVEVLERLIALEQPTLAVVDGPAVGAGWGLALACDLCLASERARFCLPELRAGYRTPSVLVDRLIQAVGPFRAADVMFSGDSYAPDDPRIAGWCGRVVPSDGLAAEALELAGALAATPRAAVAAVVGPLRRSAPQRRFPPTELFWTEEDRS